MTDRVAPKKIIMVATFARMLSFSLLMQGATSREIGGGADQMDGIEKAC